MGILITKMQGGGNLFADPRYLKLASVGNPQGQVGRSQGARQIGMVKPVNPTKQTSGLQKTGLEGALPSDIDFYNAESDRIRKSIADGINANSNFDTTPEYRILQQEKYTLESEFAPKLKIMADYFKKNKANFTKSGAERIPAIVDGAAIVQNKEGTFGVIEINELITNASNYKLLSGADILAYRFNKAEFSGFTMLGKKADKILENAYGDTKYNKELSSQIKDLGYIKTNAGYSNTKKNNEILDLDNIEYEDNGLVRMKNNKSNLYALFTDLISNDNSNFNNYLRNKSVDLLYRKSRSGEFKLDEKETLSGVILNNMAGTLANKLKANVIIDEEARRSKVNASGGNSGKDVKRPIFATAVSQILMNQEHIALNYLKEEDADLYNLVYKMPGAFLQQGAAVMEAGYKTNNKGVEDEGVSGLNRRILSNNYLINSIKGGKGEITNAEGINIMEFVDDKNEQYITTPKNTAVHMVLAPVVKDGNGKDVVNFKSEHSVALLKAIEATYRELADEKIGSEDIASGDRVLIEKVQKIANKQLKLQFKGKNVLNIPKIQIVMAFDVVYETDNAHADYKLVSEMQEGDIAILDAVIDRDVSDGFAGKFKEYTRRQKVFVPISDTFWTRMFAKSGIYGEFVDTYTPDEWNGALTSNSGIGMLDYGAFIDNISTRDFNKKRFTKKEMNGGKLNIEQGIKELLFN